MYVCKYWIEHVIFGLLHVMFTFPSWIFYRGLYNSPVSQGISLSGEYPEQRKVAHTLQQPADDWRAIFHKYCCYTKFGGTTTNLILRNLMGTYYWYLKMPKCGYMEHGLKDIAFYVQKHMAHRTVCYNFPLVRDNPHLSNSPIDCPCGIWCHGLTTCLLNDGPLFGNGSGFVMLT